MRLLLYAPDVSEDGKLIFPFVDQDDPDQIVIVIEKVVSTEYLEADILAAKTAAIDEARVIATTNEENRTVRDRGIVAITEAGLGAEEIP
jgi:hypothetical protein